MRHRDRVLAALSHEPPDRCPMQISFTPEFAERLRADIATRPLRRAGGQVKGTAKSAGHLGHNPHGGGNTYELERALGIDMLQTSVGWANSYYQAGDSYTDEWGIGWQNVPYNTPFGVGH